ncbi:hypothetical protein K1F50_20450 [Muricauda oceani]|jgi:Family of unknown function (DUF6922)|uniref:DUF6922 domain-containing protein n=2 Tax=Flagellimonas TaxID=444459 RepID=A0A6G7IYA8_9FLAO|nr:MULTISPECIES: hypothetical protein [Allomuricauda]MBW8245186.1 hypothetical protein [Allomuricauda oceani]MDF0708805.1 hypothetical protein [[Muricauda] okinawensis]QII43593.1 hypothetical protein GVT53_02475 [Allomuricauda oceani]
MERQRLNKDHLNPATFWDVDINLLDAEKDRDFIIVRVLERGTDPEIGLIELIYLQRDHLGIGKKDP